MLNKVMLNEFRYRYSFEKGSNFIFIFSITQTRILVLLRQHHWLNNEACVSCSYVSGNWYWYHNHRESNTLEIVTIPNRYDLETNNVTLHTTSEVNTEETKCVGMYPIHRKFFVDGTYCTSVVQREVITSCNSKKRIWKYCISS